jgi:hypothetical protein
MQSHFNLRRTLQQYSTPSSRIHQTLSSLPRTHTEEPWMQDIRCLLMPWKAWRRKTTVEAIALLLKAEGFQVKMGTQTREEQCVHVYLEESKDWSLAEVQICGGLLTNIFLHAE